MKSHLIQLVLAVIVLTVSASGVSAQNSIPSTPHEAVDWLEQNHCSVKKNRDGAVVEVTLGYLPRVFVIGDLDVFPELESVKLDYSSRLSDVHMSGVARLATLKRISFNNCDGLTEASLAVLHYLPALEEVEIQSCDSVYSLASLQACRNLRRIKIADSEHFNFYGLKKIVGLPHLEELNLNDNSTLEDEHLQLLAEAKGLKVLELIGCSSITDEGLNVLRFLPELTRLNLYRCRNVTGTALENASEKLEFLVMRQTEFNADGLQHLTRFRNLKELYFGHHDSFTEESLFAMTTSDQLEKMALDGVAVTEAHFEKMAGCKKLRILYLTECENVTGAGLSHLAGSQDLEVLELIRCRRIDSPDMNAIAAFKNLRHLDLSGTRVRADGIAELTALSKLEYLNLSGCKWIDDPSLQSISEIKSLKRLKLNGVRRVTDDGIRSLAGLPALKSLIISRNRQITGIGFEAFSADSPLTSLELHAMDKLSPTGLHSLVNLGNLERLEIECRYLQNAHLLAMQGIPKLKSFDIEDLERVDTEIYRRFYRSLPSYDY